MTPRKKKPGTPAVVKVPERMRLPHKARDAGIGVNHVLAVAKRTRIEGTQPHHLVQMPLKGPAGKIGAIVLRQRAPGRPLTGWTPQVKTMCGLRKGRVSLSLRRLPTVDCLISSSAPRAGL